VTDLVEINAPFGQIASLEAERAVLGGILLENTAYPEAAGSLKPQDFSLDSHRILYRRMADLAEADRSIDLITMIDELSRHNELEKIGDVGYVSSLVDGVPDRPSIANYVRIVKEKAQLRSLIVASKNSIERVFAGEAPVDVAGAMVDAALDIQAYSTRAQAVRPKDFMFEVKEELERQSKIQGLVGLPTGLDNLDEVTGGLRRGELVCIGARPGAGKSALACQMVAANSEANTDSIFFSLEMGRTDIGRRFIAMTTDVTSKQLRHPHLIQDAGWKTIGRALGDIASWPMVIDDNGSLSINELLARAKLAINRGALLVVVDYLQLVRADGRELRERVGKVANALRLLAKHEKVAVVMLSQLRRPHDVNDEPTLIDLKESGDIEAHSHVVLLIHSPIADDGSPSGEDRIIIAKNRNGVRGSIPVKFVGDKMKFYSRYLG
jgi:replicative DNA helicase